MPLVNPLPMIKKAQELSISIPAFNIHNLETLQGIIEGITLERTPAIIQASPGTVKYMGLEYIAALVKAASEMTDMPIALHIDHCSSYEILVKCVRLGFTSLMADGAELSYDENVKLCAKTAELGHAAGCCVEGELGKIGGIEDDLCVDSRHASMTVPEEAAEFVLATGIDTLAVAIGTAHGRYKGEPKLDFDRLSQIRKVTPVPLVLHGASGVPAEALLTAMDRGICKINIATEIKIPFAATIKEVFAKDPDEEDPRVYLGAGRASVVELVRLKVRQFRASGFYDKL